VRVTLTEEEWEEAKRIGKERTIQNENSKDKAYYDRSRMVYEDDAVAGHAAAAAECAVAKATNRTWHAKVWPAAEHWRHKDEPDVGRNIEVRHVTKSHFGLVVRKKDLGSDKVLFLAYPDPATDFREVEVIGWMKAEDAWENGEPAYEDSKRVRQSLLSTLV
jgi:hypothetical protein